MSHLQCERLRGCVGAEAPEPIATIASPSLYVASLMRYQHKQEEGKPSPSLEVIPVNKAGTEGSIMTLIQHHSSANSSPACNRDSSTQTAHLHTPLLHDVNMTSVQQQCSLCTTSLPCDVNMTSHTINTPPQQATPPDALVSNHCPHQAPST